MFDGRNGVVVPVLLGDHVLEHRGGRLVVPAESGQKCMERAYRNSHRQRDRLDALRRNIAQQPQRKFARVVKCAILQETRCKSAEDALSYD
jgi:hypothetical protein